MHFELPTFTSLIAAEWPQENHSSHTSVHSKTRQSARARVQPASPLHKPPCHTTLFTPALEARVKRLLERSVARAHAAQPGARSVYSRTGRPLFSAAPSLLCRPTLDEMPLVVSSATVDGPARRSQSAFCSTPALCLLQPLRQRPQENALSSSTGQAVQREL